MSFGELTDGLTEVVKKHLGILMRQMRGSTFAAIVRELTHGEYSDKERELWAFTSHAIEDAAYELFEVFASELNIVEKPIGWGHGRDNPENEYYRNLNAAGAHLVQKRDPAPVLPVGASSQEEYDHIIAALVEHIGADHEYVQKMVTQNLWVLAGGKEVRVPSDYPSKNLRGRLTGEVIDGTLTKKQAWMMVKGYLGKIKADESESEKF